MRGLQQFLIAGSLLWTGAAFSAPVQGDKDHAEVSRHGRIILAQEERSSPSPSEPPHRQQPAPPGQQAPGQQAPGQQAPGQQAPAPPQLRAGPPSPQPGQVQPRGPAAPAPIQAPSTGAVTVAPAPFSTSSPEPSTVGERTFLKKFGTHALEQLKNIAPTTGDPGGERDRGAGAPHPSIGFDGAGPYNTARPDFIRPSTEFFRPQANQFYPRGRSPSQINVPPPVITQSTPPTTRQNSEDIIRSYRSIPGGVVLEGTAANLGPVTKVQYDARINALLLDDRAAYFVPIPAVSVAVLCRAIGQDTKVGVSLGRTHIVYGAVPLDSDLALDLKIADHFLGDIVFASDNWTKGYRFANGYKPQHPQDRGGNVAVFFKFNGFQFAIQNEEVRLAHANFQVQLVPLSEKKSAEGGHLPDFDAITAGRTFREYQSNATHIAENIQYYRQENIVDRMFLYGEATAFIRGLKDAGVNLDEIARTIEAAIGVPSAAPHGAPRVASIKLPISDPEALREIRNRLYELNFDPSADLTDAAIREFEAANNLRQTGVATEELLERLRGSQKLTPWGVMVYGRTNKKFGMSWAHATRAEAVADAKSACGRDCAFELSFYGQECAALVHSDRAFAMMARPSLPQALDEALADCRKRGKECQIVASVCANGEQRYTATK
jgi:hypothetical protein